MFGRGEDQGRALENIVYLQLARQNKEVYFHKEKQECDFLVREGYDLREAIQVSVSLRDEKTKQREIGGLVEAIATYQLDRGLIITEDESFVETIEDNGKRYRIIAKPCWEWLLDS